MSRVWRRIGIAILTLAVITGIGKMLDRPPAFLDAISGATPVEAGARTEREDLEGQYVLGTCREAIRDEAAANMAEIIFNMAEADTWDERKEGMDVTPQASPDRRLVLCVPEGDAALQRYAQELRRRLPEEMGAALRIRSYESTMLRSRLMAGKYDLFLVSRGLMDLDLVAGADKISLDAAAMIRQMKDGEQ